jgi:hypothetical protein
VIRIAVEQEILDANPGLPPGEPFSHGVYENAAGNSDEFVPGVTDECPECYAVLEEWFVGRASGGEHEPVDRLRPLLAVCVECDYVPYKDEVVTLYPAGE